LLTTRSGAPLHPKRHRPHVNVREVIQRLEAAHHIEFFASVEVAA
jgi:hypothetical protein